MKQLIRDTNILFFHTSPETLLYNLIDGHYSDDRTSSEENTDSDPCKAGETSDSEKDRIPVVIPGKYNCKAYEIFGMDYMGHLTLNEIDNCYKYLCGNHRIDDDFFGILAKTTVNFISRKDNDFVCRRDKFLDWTDLTKHLGQDIFITALMAREDSRNPRQSHEFLWAPVIGLDDDELNSIYERGLAENHYHLKGSTQSFSLSWISLMNYTDELATDDNIEEVVTESLYPNLFRHISAKPYDWKKRIRIASYIRILLYKRLTEKKSVDDKNGNDDESTLRKTINENISLFKREHEETGFISILRDELSALRKLSVKFPQPDRKSESEDLVLDYVLSSKNIYLTLSRESHFRILAGERSFLYGCLYEIYARRFGRLEQILFYAYLLIKSKFRAEIVQTNKIHGFKNFTHYEYRKDIFFDEKPQYKSESRRLSVCAPLMDENVSILEARIAPKDTLDSCKKQISDTDKDVRFAICGKKHHNNKDYMENSDEVPSQDWEDIKRRFFYGFHFVKRPYTGKIISEETIMRSATQISPVYRHKCFRENIDKLTQIIINIRNEKSLEVSSRLRCIDACNEEIGCRPELFAPSFRYLRNHKVASPMKVRSYKPNNDENAIPDLKVTYHVGEDFIDICDGLRAVDEALLFLAYKDGDRIGHGLCLWTDPYRFYSLDGRTDIINISKQDMLDNVIWLMYRYPHISGSDLVPSVRGRLYTIAEALFSEIYLERLGKILNMNTGSISPIEFEQLLVEYYHSWVLRGDHPSLYDKNGFSRNNTASYKGVDTYQMLISDEYPDISDYRDDHTIAMMVYLYQYDPTVKAFSDDIYKWTVDDWYKELMKAAQDAMKHRLCSGGIIVESNPTSNVLIGQFDDYTDHPIVKVLGDELRRGYMDPECPEITINTDDIGVFGVSLEQQYNLVFSALRRLFPEDKYTSDIYAQMERIRALGHRSSFTSEAAS